MHCPHCGHQDSRVIDSRATSSGIRRRRQCSQCTFRFTTYERLQSNSLMIIKKDGRREEFNRDKLLGGLRKACAKRPVSEAALEKTVDHIEQKLFRLGKTEVQTSLVGELVMEGLEPLDRVAYLRFASVYREFADLEAFRREVEALLYAHKPAEVSVQLPMVSRGNTTVPLVDNPRREGS